MVLILGHGISELFCNCLLVEEIPIILPSTVPYICYSSPFSQALSKPLAHLYLLACPSPTLSQYGQTIAH